MTLTPSMRAISLCSLPCLAKSFARASFVATSTLECRLSLAMPVCPQPLRASVTSQTRQMLFFGQTCAFLDKLSNKQRHALMSTRPSSHDIGVSHAPARLRLRSHCSLTRASRTRTSQSHRHEHRCLSRCRLSYRLGSRHLVARDHDVAFCTLMDGHDRSARALSLSRLIFQPVAAGAVGLGLTFGSEKLVSNINAAFYGFVQNKPQALLDVNFYNVCDDQEGKIMFERVNKAQCDRRGDIEIDPPAHNISGPNGWVK
jgi:hypothetical protein